MLKLKEQFEFPLEDGTSEEVCKDLQKTQEDEVKELNDHNEEVLKDVEEINGKERTLTEKITLPEPMPYLNEDLGVLGALSAVSSIASIANSLKDESLDDLEDDEDSEDGEDLEEALPSDLAKAYKGDFQGIKAKGDYYPEISNNQGYKGIRGQANVDFQNSTYTPISIEEFKKLRKAKLLGNVQMVFAGGLIAFNDEGKQLTKVPASWNNREKFTYNGKRAEWSTGIPIGELAERADAIYIVNEAPIDANERVDRRANPESKFSGNDSIVKRDLNGERYDFAKNGWFMYNTESQWQDALLNKQKYVQQRKDRLTDMLDNAGQYTSYDFDAAKRRLETAEDDLKNYKNEYNKWKQKNVDTAVAKRYGFSNTKSREVFDQYKDVKDSIKYDQGRLLKAQKELDDAKQNGSPAVVRTKNDIEYYRKQIQDYKRKLQELEIQLMDIDDDENVTQLQKNLDSIAAGMKVNQDKLDKILRRNQP